MNGSPEDDPIQRKIAERARLILGDIPVVDDEGQPILLDVSDEETQPDHTHDLVA